MLCVWQMFSITLYFMSLSLYNIHLSLSSIWLCIYIIALAFSNKLKACLLSLSSLLKREQTGQGAGHLAWQGEAFLPALPRLFLFSLSSSFSALFLFLHLLLSLPLSSLSSISPLLSSLLTLADSSWTPAWLSHIPHLLSSHSNISYLSC